jgi:predicted transposase YdaD
VAEMDQGIKRLVQSHPADVLALAVPGAEYLGPLTLDVATEPQLVLDTLMRVRFEGVECAVDLEAEARPHPEIARRLYEYGTRASVVTRLPVISVVLWLEPNGAAPPSPYELRAGTWLLATWHFIGIRLFDLPAETLFERGLVGLLPLAPFTRDGHDLAVIERAAAVVKERAAPDDVAELESLLAVFGSRTFGAAEMRALLRRVFMSTEIIGTSALYQEWIQEGESRGKAEGVRETVLLLLRARFGELAPEVEQAVTVASVERLEALMPTFATGDLTAVRTQLGLPEA